MEFILLLRESYIWHQMIPWILSIYIMRALIRDTYYQSERLAVSWKHCIISSVYSLRLVISGPHLITSMDKCKYHSCPSDNIHILSDVKYTDERVEGFHIFLHSHVWLSVNEADHMKQHYKLIQIRRVKIHSI